MILEIADISIKPEMQRQFEQGVAQALPIFRSAKGFVDLELRRGIEDPFRYHLMVNWDSVADHVEHFQASEGFREWRKLVGACFSKPPLVDHSERLLSTAISDSSESR